MNPLIEFGNNLDKEYDLYGWGITWESHPTEKDQWCGPPLNIIDYINDHGTLCHRSHYSLILKGTMTNLDRTQYNEFSWPLYIFNPFYEIFDISSLNFEGIESEKILKVYDARLIEWGMEGFSGDKESIIGFQIFLPINSNVRGDPKFYYDYPVGELRTNSP